MKGAGGVDRRMASLMGVVTGLGKCERGWIKYEKGGEVAVSQPCRFGSDPNQRSLGFGFDSSSSQVIAEPLELSLFLQHI